MKGFLTVIAAILFTGHTVKAQTKVANYSIGKYGTDKYEHLSFWVKSGQRTAIYYRYGKAGKEFTLRYSGKARLNNTAGFTVQFSNGHTLTLIPSGINLEVIEAGKTPKTFAWEYEGPIDGIGTFCEPCAEDEKAAMQIMKAYYLK